MRTGPAETALTRISCSPRSQARYLHGRVERRLRHAHHVVVRHRALAAEVGHRHDRAAAGGLQQRLGGAGGRDERVGADVDRHPEAVARRVGEAALEVLGGREGDRVDEQVELAVPAPRRPRGRRARRPRRSGRRTRSRAGADRAGELADVALDPLALEGEGELARPRRRAAARSPRRSSACSRRRGSARASRRTDDIAASLGYVWRACAASSDRSHSARRSWPRRLRPPSFQPIDRRRGEVELPRVRAGTITVPAGARTRPDHRHPDARRSRRSPPIRARSRRTSARAAAETSSALVARVRREAPARPAGRGRAAAARDPGGARCGAATPSSSTGWRSSCPRRSCATRGQALVHAQALPELPLHARAQPQPRR